MDAPLCTTNRCESSESVLIFCNVYNKQKNNDNQAITKKSDKKNEILSCPCHPCLCPYGWGCSCWLLLQWFPPCGSWPHGCDHQSRLPQRPCTYLPWTAPYSTPPWLSKICITQVQVCRQGTSRRKTYSTGIQPFITWWTTGRGLYRNQVCTMPVPLLRFAIIRLFSSIPLETINLFLMSFQS